MKHIGFVGFGIMGRPMAANLVDAGYPVTGYNRTPSKLDDFVERGGRRAASIKEAVEEADIVITMLADTPDVEEVVRGEDGVFDHAREGALIIDMSTIRPDVSRLLAEEGAQRGLRFIDAPVSGGEAAAVEGTLSVMVGGDPLDLADALPMLEVLGKTVVRVGSVGAGGTVKAANQLLVAGGLQLVSEALVFLAAHDVDRSAAVEVLNGGLAGSTVLTRKAASMLARDFEPGFRVDLHHKDLSILQDTARRAGVAIPLGAQVAELMASLRAQGAGGLDHSALLLLAERMSGAGQPLTAEMPMLGH